MSTLSHLFQPPLLRLSVDWLWRCDPDGVVTALEPGRQALPTGLEALLLGQRLHCAGRMTGATGALLESIASLAGQASFEQELRLDDPTCNWQGLLVGMPQWATDQTLLGFVGSARTQPAPWREQGRPLAHRELDELYRTLAHDLQNPLNGALGFADLLARRPAVSGDPTSQRMLGLISRSATDMKAVVDAVMDLHRVTGTQPSPVAVNLTRLIDQAQALLRQQHPLRPARVERPSSALVWADLALLQQAVTTLLRRCWLSLPETAPVVVDVTHQRLAQGALLSFTDQGTGVQAERAHELFMPLRDPRGKNSGAAPELGLALVARAVEHMGGWVWVDGSHPVGQTVHVFLPARHVPELSELSELSEPSELSELSKLSELSELSERSG